MTTNEKNRMIAEFMGGRMSKDYEDTWHFDTTPTIHSSYQWQWRNMEYHTSWDWLMPVWAKIVREAIDNTSSAKATRYIKNKLSEYSAAVAVNEIETAYEIAYTVLHWYTTQQKESGDE